MINFLGNKIQKSMANINKKTVIEEADILVAIREIKMALLEADVNLNVVKDFINNVKEKAIGKEVSYKLNAGQQFLKIVKGELQRILGGETKGIKLSKIPTIIMMVGLQGSGKTTSVAKMAKYFVRKKEVKKPLLVAADIYRPAAIEQLQTLGKNNHIDVYASSSKIDPVDICKQAIKYAKENENDLVIIDTAGRLSIDEKLMQELVDIKHETKPNEIIFVADALSGQDIINVATIFNNQLKLSGAIITKLDSDARGGAAFSIANMLNIPIRFIGTGEKVESFDLFHPDRMADRILGMGDVLSLIEKAEEVIDKDEAAHMANRLSAGHFDLNDLMSQLRQIKKLGKLSKVLKMIPGVQKIPQDKIDGASEKIKLFEIIISSMTNQERKFPRLLKQPKRKERILKGCGRSAKEYNTLVAEFDRMQKQMKYMARQIKDGKFNPGMFGGIGA